jgi:signal transduction histidine kinase
MSRRLLIALVLTGAAATGTAASLVLYAHDFQPPGSRGDLGQVAVDVIWIATGLIAWRRRPDNRVGPLMTAFGFLDLSGQLYWNNFVPFALASLVSSFQIPVAVHLFLAYPSGRLTTRFERSLVAFTYGVFAVQTALSPLVDDTRTAHCPNCPGNPVRLVDSRPTQDVLMILSDVIVAVVLATTVVLMVRRLRRASGATRRALGLVLGTSAIAVVLFLPSFIVDAAGRVVDGTFLAAIGGVGFLAIPFAFLVGLLRTRLHRGAVADLVVELGSSPSPGRVRDAIARTLGDPSLRLGFWLPDGERYVDPDGQTLDLENGPTRAISVLEHDGQRLAALAHDPSLLDERELLDAVGAAASLALENARLQAELRAQLAEVRASRARIVEAGDAERRRLERDLHDGAQQRLLGIRLALQLARGQAADERALEQLLAEADAEVVAALAELRALARGIHPAILTDEGLAPALAALARRTPIPVELAVCPERLPAPVEATVYFVAAEALANVAKHAHASRVTLQVARTNGRVAIEIGDDGIGGADTAATGLRGLRDRVEALDGRLRIDSPPHNGTRITAAIPCA